MCGFFNFVSLKITALCFQRAAWGTPGEKMKWALSPGCPCLQGPGSGGRIWGECYCHMAKDQLCGETEFEDMFLE